MKTNKALKYIRLAETLDKHGDFIFSEVAFSLAQSSSNLRFAEKEEEEEDELFNHLKAAHDANAETSPDLIYSPDYFMADSAVGPQEHEAYYEFPQYSDSNVITHQTGNSQLNIPQLNYDHTIFKQLQSSMFEGDEVDYYDSLKYCLNLIRQDYGDDEQKAKSWILNLLKYDLKIVNTDSALVDYIFSVLSDIDSNFDNIVARLKEYIKEINTFRNEVFESPKIKEIVNKQFERFKDYWSGVISYFDKTGATLPDQYKDWNILYMKFVQELKNLAVSYGVKFLFEDNLVGYLSEHWDFIERYQSFSSFKYSDEQNENVFFHGNTKTEKDYFYYLREKYPNLFNESYSQYNFYKNDLKFYKANSTDPRKIREIAITDGLKAIPSNKIELLLATITYSTKYVNISDVKELIDKTDSAYILSYAIDLLSSNEYYKLKKFNKLSKNIIDFVAFASTNTKVYDYVLNNKLINNLDSIKSYDKYSNNKDFIIDLVVSKYPSLKSIYEKMEPYDFDALNFYPGILFGIKHLIDSGQDISTFLDSDLNGIDPNKIRNEIADYILDSAKILYRDQKYGGLNFIRRFKIPAEDINYVKEYVDSRFSNKLFSNFETTQSLITNIDSDNLMYLLKEFSAGEQDFLFNYCIKKANITLSSYSPADNAQRIQRAFDIYFKEAKEKLQETKIKNSFLIKDADGEYTVPKRQDVKDTYLTIISSNFDALQNLPQSGIQDLLSYLDEANINPSAMTNQDLNYIGNAFMIFGKMTLSYLRRYPAKNLHDKTVFLPTLKEFNPEIRDFLLNNILKSTRDPALYLAGFWDDEITFDGVTAKVSEHIKNKADIKKLELAFRLIDFSKEHGDYEDEDFAVEFLKSADKKNPLYDQTIKKGFKYSYMEDWYQMSKSMPLPLWARKVITKDGFTAKFLPKNDTRIMFAGKFTGCCQTLYHYAQSCAFDSQLSPKSALFVILNNKNEMYAQSYCWESENGSTIVVDSMEFKPGLTEQVQEVINNIYLDYFESFAGLGRMVNFGNNTLPENEIKRVEVWKTYPTNPFRSQRQWKQFSDGYTSDSDTQYTLKYTESDNALKPGFQTTYNIPREELIKLLNEYKKSKLLNFYDLLALAPIDFLQEAIPKEELDLKTTFKIYRKNPDHIMSPEIQADLVKILDYILNY